MLNQISNLKSGKLFDCFKSVEKGLIYNMDVKRHADVYIGEHKDSYAEPEFTGKYINLCSHLYNFGKDENALKNAKTVVESVIKNAREDGYLGCISKGKEIVDFSVWNQAFTIHGLLKYYEVSEDEKALLTAEKCSQYVMDYFIDGNIDILDAPNYGTQHISMLFSLCDLYRITRKEKIKKYILYIVNKIKGSDLDFFDFDNILNLRSRKGIENFVILLGILKYAELFDDKKAIESVKKYWQQVADTQIRNTGNGTICELWSEKGNACMVLGAEERPNENCVAVGWAELSMALFFKTREAKYLDEIDKTLYNHLLGSFSESDCDFAYYQPNFGKRIRTSNPNMYKCCRYRGYTFFTYLNDMLFFEDDNCIIPLIYTNSQHKSDDCEIEMTSDYPCDNKIRVTAKSNKSKILKLRVPKYYEVCKFSLNGKESDANVVKGYIEVLLEQEKECTVELILKSEVRAEFGEIDKQRYVAFSYGCVLLAATGVNSEISMKESNLKLKRMSAEKGEMMRFSADGVSEGEDILLIFSDYAAADNYSVWIPIE